MEVGADKRSLTILGGALAVLAVVLYFQYFRDSGAAPPPRPAPRTQASTGVRQGESRPAPRAPAGRFGGRHERGRGGGEAGETMDPMTADIALRTDLLERIRGLEAPTVERDIFNFGRPKRPEPEPLPQQVQQEAQSLLEAEMEQSETEEAPAPALPQPEPPKAVPPRWKYFGLAGDPSSSARRAFLLDGEEILVAEEGLLLQERYRIEGIAADAITVLDREADQTFAIRLEVSP